MFNLLEKKIQFYFHELSEFPLCSWLMMSLSFRLCEETIKKQWKFSFTARADFMYVQIDSHFSYGFYLSLVWQTVRRKWETSGVIDNSVFDSFTLRGLSAFLYAYRGLSVFPAGRDDSDKKLLIVWWMARGRCETGDH